LTAVATDYDPIRHQARWPGMHLCIKGDTTTAASTHNHAEDDLVSSGSTVCRSEIARQFASFAQRTSRPISAFKSRSSGLPFSHIEFAFFTNPVERTIVPGMPSPINPFEPVRFSNDVATSEMACNVPS